LLRFPHGNSGSVGVLEGLLLPRQSGGRLGARTRAPRFWSPSPGITVEVDPNQELARPRSLHRVVPCRTIIIFETVGGGEHHFVPYPFRESLDRITGNMLAAAETRL